MTQQNDNLLRYLCFYWPGSIRLEWVLYARSNYIEICFVFIYLIQLKVKANAYTIIGDLIDHVLHYILV